MEMSKQQVRIRTAEAKKRIYTNNLQPEELRQLIYRVTNGAEAYVSAFDFVLMERDDAKDAFAIEDGGDGKIRITATNGVAACAAISWYLREKCNCFIGPLTRRLGLPDTPPCVGEKYETLSPFLYRFFFNYCTFGYTMPFWTWKEFEDLTDWLLLSGVNLMLNPVGHENVWYQLLTAKGYTDEQAKKYLCDPAHLPWQWMGNMSGYDRPLTDRWLEEQKVLSQRINAKMNAFGAEIVLPGYCGFVPDDFREHYPDAKIVAQGDWFGYVRPAILDHNQPIFTEMAHAFYDITKELFGDCAFYSADPFHEGGIVEGMDVIGYGQTALAAMKYANPNAVWLLQGWQDNPKRSMLNTFNPEDVLIANLLADRNFNAGDDFGNNPWMYTTVNNFGGTRNMSGKLRLSLQEPYRLYDQDPENCLVGVGMMPEAITIDEIFYDVLNVIAFTAEQPDLSGYITHYVKRRYGVDAPNATEAFQVLGNHIYTEGGIDSPQESVLCARPNLQVTSVSTWGGQTPTYENKYLYHAAALAIKDFDTCCGSDCFTLDMVDLFRQCLANHARGTLAAIKEAWDAKDKQAFYEQTEAFLYHHDLQEELLKCHSITMLGTYLAEAERREPDDPMAQRAIRYMVRRLFTTWGNKRPAQWLRDYAHREYSGMISHFYRPRWSAFFNLLGLYMDAPEEMEDPDWYEWEELFVYNDEHFDTVPSQDLKPILLRIASFLELEKYESI